MTIEIRSHGETIIQGIQVPKGRLPIDETVVTSLMASIKEVGVVIAPVIVWEPKPQLGMYLVVGANRLEAYKRLKLKSIPTRIVRGNTPEIQRWVKLAEIDENLVRRKLSAAQRAKLTAQRKAVYVEEHPETKKGSAGGRAKAAKGKGAKRQNGATHGTFVKDTAKKTGRSKRNIERDARRGETLTDDILDKVEGTSLAKGVELDALTNMKPEAREALVSRAVAGEQVSAVKGAPIHSRGELEPADDRDTEIRAMIDDFWRCLSGSVISGAAELPPKVYAKLFRALRGLAQRATQLADKLEEQAKTRAQADGNGTDPEASAEARKIANADDE